MKRKKILSILSVLLVSSMLMSCSLFDQGSHRRTRRDRDDGDDGHTGLTRPVRETSEETTATSVEVTSVPTEPTNTVSPVQIEPGYASYYLDVIAEYEDRIIQFEDEFRTYQVPSINFYDIDGDEVEELMFKYQTEPYCANLAIFRYDPSTDTVVELFDQCVEQNMGSWSPSCDVVYLNDGDLLITDFMGSGGTYYQEMVTYTLTPDGYSLTGTWELEEHIADDDHGDPSYTIIPGEATYNGSVIPYQDFYDAQENYIARISSPVMPYSGRLYYDDYVVRDIFDRDWCSIPGIRFSLGNYMYLEEFLELAE